MSSSYGSQGSSVSPPPVYYRYSLKGERGTDGYRISAHVYANTREEAVEELGKTLIQAEAMLESLKLPVTKKIKE